MKETIDSLRFRITKRFGTKTVLQDFALEVRGKQFITFLGPSGCGKSTALNAGIGEFCPSNLTVKKLNVSAI